MSTVGAVISAGRTRRIRRGCTSSYCPVPGSWLVRDRAPHGRGPSGMKTCRGSPNPARVVDQSGPGAFGQGERRWRREPGGCRKRCKGGDPEPLAGTATPPQTKRLAAGPWRNPGGKRQGRQLLAPAVAGPQGEACVLHAQEPTKPESAPLTGPASPVPSRDSGHGQGARTHKSAQTDRLCR